MLDAKMLTYLNLGIRHLEYFYKIFIKLPI